MMKTTKTVMLLFLLTTAMNITAQVSINVNIGTPPAWAPAAPENVQYYYLPDIEVYYDVPAHRYIYRRNGVWTRSANLPSRYRGYDLYHGQTVYLSDYRGKAPYSFYKAHKGKYHGNGNWKKMNYERPQENKRNRNEKEHGKGHGHRKD